MSYIIDQFEDSPFWTYKQDIKSHFPQPTYLLQTYSLENRKEALLNSLGKTRKSIMLFSVGRWQITFSVHLPAHFLVLLKIKKDRHGDVYFQLRLLTPEGRPLTMGTHQRRLLFYKRISGGLVGCTFQEFRIIVGLANGEVKMQSVGYRISGNCPSLLERLFQHTLLTLPQSLQSWPLNVVREMCSESSQQLQKELALRMEGLQAKKLYYYSQFSNVFVNLAVNPTGQQQSIVKQQKKEEQAITALKNSFVSPDLRSGLVLFSPNDLAQLRSEVQNFDLTTIEREEIISKISLPRKAPLRRGEMQVQYVLSHIKLIKNKEEAELIFLNSGGFSNIYLAEIQYQYVGSYGQPGQPSEVMKGIPTQKNQIVIKRDLPNGKSSRVAHEKEILQHIKNGMSWFLPKYYIISDLTSPFAKDLLMEAIQYPTLFNFLLKKRESLTLQSKIYLAVMIAQALRYLQDYRIAHLDLKPENIMLSRELSIKLIDFGDAYHPEVKKAHRQGFTPPYSAPENYFSPPTYSYKNDVFSFGVILHEFLLARTPFQICDDKLRNEAYLKRKIHDFWWCVPEENLNFGEPITFPVLQLLASKCLSLNPSERPELQWIVLTLKNCIEILWP